MTTTMVVMMLMVMWWWCWCWYCCCWWWWWWWCWRGWLALVMMMVEILELLIVTATTMVLMLSSDNQLNLSTNSTYQQPQLINQLNLSTTSTYQPPQLINNLNLSTTSTYQPTQLINQLNLSTTWNLLQLVRDCSRLLLIGWLLIKAGVFPTARGLTPPGDSSHVSGIHNNEVEWMMKLKNVVWDRCHASATLLIQAINQFPSILKCFLHLLSLSKSFCRSIFCLAFSISSLVLGVRSSVLRVTAPRCAHLEFLSFLFFSFLVFVFCVTLPRLLLSVCFWPTWKLRTSSPGFASSLLFIGVVLSSPLWISKVRESWMRDAWETWRPEIHGRRVRFGRSPIVFVQNCFIDNYLFIIYY